MSDTFYRPTLTFPAPGAYNATQVRLYGVIPKQNAGIVYPLKSQLIQEQAGDVKLGVNVTTGDEAEDRKLHARIKGLWDGLTSRENEASESPRGGNCGIDAVLFKQIVDGKLDFPRDLPLSYVTQVPIETKKMGTVALTASISLADAVAARKVISAGIVVAYAFEGHTYDLPKPKIMIIPTLPEPRIPDDDSGFDRKESEGYAVWIVDKLDECIEFEMNQGFVEQLVLESNLPGKRAPNMYAGRMMMGHRSGRLSE